MFAKGLLLTLRARWDKVERAILATEILAGAINPHVGGLHNVLLQRQCQIPIQDGLVDARIGRVFQNSSRHTMWVNDVQERMK